MLSSSNISHQQQFEEFPTCGKQVLSPKEEQKDAIRAVYEEMVVSGFSINNLILDPAVYLWLQVNGSDLCARSQLAKLDQVL